MRIDSIRPVTPLTDVKSTDARGPAFPVPQQPTGAPAARPAAVGLLAPSVVLFCNAEPEQRRRSELLVGQDFLKRLEDARRQLIARRLPRRALEALSDDIASAPRPEDAELAEIYDDIALRVAIELARQPDTDHRA